MHGRIHKLNGARGDTPLWVQSDGHVLTAPVLVSPSNSLRATAVSRAIGHCGEILQGALRVDSATHRFLVSLPSMAFTSTASIVRDESSDLRVKPAGKQKALRAARLTAAVLGTHNLRGTLTIASRMPISRGCGSSTADCTSTVRAVAQLLNRSVSPESTARIVHAAELASDGTMFDLVPVALRHREGLVQDYLGSSWPEMFVVVIDTVPDCVGIDTLALDRPRYSFVDLQRFQDAMTKLRNAIANGNATDVGEVATWSAEVNNAYLPKKHWPALKTIARSAGAYGIAASHSGTVVAFLLPYALIGSKEAQVLRHRVVDLGCLVIAESSFCDDVNSVEAA